VPAGHPSNSSLNLRIYDDVKAYTLDSLQPRRRRQLKQAAKQLIIRPLTDPTEFKNQAYPVYLSFYERTRYAFDSMRRYKPWFARWNVILGAYRGEQLGAVSVSQLVDETLLYSTFFCAGPFLKLGTADLMLHTVRATAAERNDIQRIFPGMGRGGDNLDRFHLMRGCKIVGKPAWLQLNRVSALLLRHCLPGQFARLCGRPDESTPSGMEDHPGEE
jgi:hypothetical protein